MRIPEPTNPWHISRAYGVQPTAVVRPAQPVQRAEAAREAETATAAHAGRTRVDRLVAGAVRGGVDFAADGEAQVRGESLAFYRRPTDANSAATGVELGRRLDASA